MRRNLIWPVCGLLLATWPGLTAQHVHAQVLTAAPAAPVRSVLFIAEADRARATAPDEQNGGVLFAAALPEPAPKMSAVRRLFEALRPAKAAAPSQAFSTGSVNETAQTIVVADADPYFARWQKDANERLKQEKAINTQGEHQVAKLHPDSFVVVCEAGCRNKVNEVVYIVSKAAAVAAKPSMPDAATLETTAASGSESGASVVTPPTSPSSTATAGADVSADASKDLPCVAGCYDRPQRRNTQNNRRAEKPALPANPLPRLAETHPVPAQLLPAAAPAVAAEIVPTAAIAKQPSIKVRSAQIGRNGAIVNAEAAQHRHAESLKFARAVMARLKTPKSWRASVQRSAGPAVMSAPRPIPRTIKASTLRTRHITRDMRASSSQMAKIRRAVARLH